MESYAGAAYSLPQCVCVLPWPSRRIMLDRRVEKLTCSAISDANVVDVANNKVREGCSVLLKGGAVVSVKPTSAADTLFADADTRVVDLDGLWLCPGLVDCRQ